MRHSDLYQGPPGMNFHSSLHAHHLGAVLGTGKRKKSWTRAVFSHLQRKGLEKRFQVKRLKTYLIFLSICGLCKYIFFSMLALLRTTSFLTTIYGPYSSHHYTHVTNYNFSHVVPLWAGFMYCIYTCLSELWVLLMLFFF